MKFLIPKGTRDFSSIEILNRNFLIKTIQNGFLKFGFCPIETPSFENVSTFTGKYGKEGECLIFKIINSGNSLKKGLSNFTKKNINNIDEYSLINHISNKALRYDLTVPFIRYISTNKNKIIFPFRRYQIQPVWRAENPQKGRFREFYQCDADIITPINSSSLWEEVEFFKLCDFIFNKLNIPTIIYINHIDILKGLAELSNIKKTLWKDFIRSLDKLGKIGKDLVKKEMIQKGISLKSINKIETLLNIKGKFFEKKNILNKLFKYSVNGKKGIKDINLIYKTIKNISLKKTVIKWDISLSRGINYYTDTIWEIVPFFDKKKSNNMFSIGGGGRYNKLTNLFGIKNFSGIGTSFGLDRIYIIMEEKKLFHTNIHNFYPAKVMFINFGYEETLHAYKIINHLREIGISTQLYPNSINISKQFKYAHNNNIPFVIIIGKKEIEKNKIKIKDIKNKKEKEFDNINDLINQLK
ncbi:histidine--tRNA ligase [Blattabacterium cuenoti]|uniref:histidine--tRNA ligase n=1 Tax=Blattabacterium cuenoti TaxID=1653831 RepID=UPI00163B9381|nr:histidine--tRNA ligase [Blattabacterium cuenoti]